MKQKCQTKTTAWPRMRSSRLLKRISPSTTHETSIGNTWRTDSPNTVTPVCVEKQDWLIQVSTKHHKQTYRKLHRWASFVLFFCGAGRNVTENRMNSRNVCLVICLFYEGKWGPSSFSHLSSQSLYYNFFLSLFLLALCHSFLCLVHFDFMYDLWSGFK